MVSNGLLQANHRKISPEYRKWSLTFRNLNILRMDSSEKESSYVQLDVIDACLSRHFYQFNLATSCFAFPIISY